MANGNESPTRGRRMVVRVEGDVRAEMAMPMRDCRVYAASLPFLAYIFLRKLSLATFS